MRLVLFAHVCKCSCVHVCMLSTRRADAGSSSAHAHAKADAAFRLHPAAFLLDYIPLPLLPFPLTCSDKTGTLTQNKMSVGNLWANQELHDGAHFQPPPKVWRRLGL